MPAQPVPCRVGPARLGRPSRESILLAQRVKRGEKDGVKGVRPPGGVGSRYRHEKAGQGERAVARVEELAQARTWCGRGGALAALRLAQEKADAERDRSRQ